MGIKPPTGHHINREQLLRRAMQGRPLHDASPTQAKQPWPGDSGVDGGDPGRALRKALGQDGVSAAKAAPSGVAQRMGPTARMTLEAEIEGRLSAAARDHFGAIPLDDYRALQSGSLNLRNPDVRTRLPASVQESYDWYFETAEANDWGTVRVLQRQVGDESVYMVATTTDGSDHYMELFDVRGAPLGSGQQMDGETTQWDANQGDCRQHLEPYR